MTFTDDEKKVFQYSDGTQTVYGDPLEINDQLLADLGGDINAVISVAWPEATVDDVPLTMEDGITPLVDEKTQKQITQKIVNYPVFDQDVKDARQKFVSAVRSAFGLPAFDPRTGTGCTMDMCLRVWSDFRDWEEGVKKKPDTKPTSSQPLEAESLPV